MPATLQRRLTFESALTVRPQHLTLNSRDYLVAPGVLIVAGVLNGGLVPSDAIIPEDWNGVPIVLDHPHDAQGQPLSARSPEVLAQYGLGHVYRAQRGITQRQGHTVTSLRAELWIDTAQATLIGGDALQVMTRLEAQDPLEVSTAFFSSAERTTGSFFGVPYTEIHHDLRPDHLALLPNSTGACDWASGCGCPRLNHQQACACQHQETPPMEQSEDKPHGLLHGLMAMVRHLMQRETPPLITAQTDTDVREALYGALAREMGTDYTPIFIDSLNLDDQTFTYRQGERLRRRGWTVDDGVLALTADVEDVQRETTYIPVPVTQEQQPPATEEAAMPPLQTHAVLATRIDRLIADPLTNWTEDDRHILQTFDEVALIRLEQQPKRTPVAAPHVPQTVDEAIKMLPTHIQEPIQAMASEYEQRKQAAIAQLIANKWPGPQEELQSYTAQRLEELVRFGGGEVAADYRGQGAAQPRPQTPVDPESLPPPTPNTLERVLERQRLLGKRV
jgi:hypothetical protein